MEIGGCISGSNMLTIGCDENLVSIKDIDINLSLYNYYVDFQIGVLPKDLVSNSLLTTALDAGRPLLVNGVYTEFGEDIPTVNELGLNTYGAFTLLNGKTNDISDAYWFGAASTPATNEFLATAQFQFKRRTLLTTVGLKYTLSFYDYVEPGGNLNSYFFRHVNSADGDNTVIPTLSYVRQRYDIQVLGEAASGTVNFGFMDGNASNWSKVFIDTINITQSSYLLPEVQNDTTGTVSIPLNHADADEGTKATGIQINFPQLYTALNGPNAKGELNIPFTFFLDATDSSGTVSVLTANDDLSFLSYNFDLEQFELYDGTNTALVPYTSVNGTSGVLKALWGDFSGQKMQLIVDATEGTKVTNVGSFPVVEDDFSHSFNNVNWIAVGPIISILKDPTW